LLGIHIGGAYSAVVPLTALYYGGILRYDPENPASLGQDLFILSKGHGVAALAAVYADLGFFDREVLKNSRSVESLLNGHPGPLLPGVHTAKLHIPAHKLTAQFQSFGWETFTADSRNYRSVLRALYQFRNRSFRGVPAAIIVQSRKGYGGFSSSMTAHKTKMDRSLYEYERDNLVKLREIQYQLFFC
jgi:transketolase N-terminal domain/subunit